MPKSAKLTAKAERRKRRKAAKAAAASVEPTNATEALATLHGYKDCYVKNATKPAVHIVGGMYEIRLNVGDFAFVVNHLEIELNAYKARRDTEEMIDDVDYESLSYHVKVKGSLSFLHTSAIPMMPNARAEIGRASCRERV